MDGLTSELYLISTILVHPPRPDKGAALRQLQKKCLSITLLRFRQNFSRAETWDFAFLNLGNALCYISLDQNMLLTGKISRGFSHHKRSKSINHMGFCRKGIGDQWK